SVLPLVKKYGAAVVAISNDETGISEDPDVRFAIAKKIVQRAADHGIPASDIVVDPLVMPIGAINQAGRQVMHLRKRLKNELRVRRAPASPWARRAVGARVGTGGAHRILHDRQGRTRRLYAVRQARPLPPRHTTPAGRPQPGGRRRLGVRRARAVRALPGAG